VPHIYSWNPLLACHCCNEYTHGTVLRVVHQQLPRRSYHLCKHKLLNNTPVYTIQPVAKPVVQPAEQPVGRTVQDLFNIHPKTYPVGAWIDILKPNYHNFKIAISPKLYIRSVKNLTTKLIPSTTCRGWSTTTVQEIQHGWRPPSWKLT